MMQLKSSLSVVSSTLLLMLAIEASRSQLSAADPIFPPGSVGQTLEQRLTPPRTVPIPVLPASTGLQPRLLPGSERSPMQPSSVAAAEILRAPIVLPDMRRSMHWSHAALDRPWLAAERDPARPFAPTLAASIPAFVAAPDPRQTARLARFAELAELKPTISDDPTALAAREVVVSSAAMPSPMPPVVVRFSIPDPFEHLRWARLKEVPPDNDSPAASLVRPVRPKLDPVQPE
jgi:hypothetical protein